METQRDALSFATLRLGGLEISSSSPFKQSVLVILRNTVSTQNKAEEKTRVRVSGQGENGGQRCLNSWSSGTGSGSILTLSSYINEMKTFLFHRKPAGVEFLSLLTEKALIFHCHVLIDLFPHTLSRPPDMTLNLLVGLLLRGKACSPLSWLVALSAGVLS